MSIIKSSELAEFLIFNSDKGLSNLELQVLMNLIVIDYENTFKEPLLEDKLINFKSYSFKVSEKVYWKYRNFGADSVTKPKEAYLDLPKERLKFLIERLNFYNKKSYWECVSIVREYFENKGV